MYIYICICIYMYIYTYMYMYMLQRLVPQPPYLAEAAGIRLRSLLSRAIYPRRWAFQRGRLDTRF